MNHSSELLIFSPEFLDAYNRLPQGVQEKIDRRLVFLSENVRHPGLRVRKMKSKHGIWEGRVDRNYRFTFEWEGSAIRLTAVGGHDIYRER